MTLRVGLWWSLYIRAGSRDKLFQNHLPAVVAAIGPIPFGWAVVTAGDDGKRFHAQTCQMLEADDSVALSVEALRRAWRLHPQWRVNGLECLNAGALSMTVAAPYVARNPIRPSPGSSTAGRRQSSAAVAPNSVSSTPRRPREPPNTPPRRSERPSRVTMNQRPSWG